MKHLISALIIYSLLNPLYSQNWFPFRQGEVMHYGLDKVPAWTSCSIIQVDTINNESIWTFNKQIVRIGQGYSNYLNYFSNNMHLLFQTQMRYTVDKVMIFESFGKLRIIKPFACLNEKWVFEPSSGTMATMSCLSIANVFGIQDSVKVILLSTGDSIVLSKQHGFLYYPLFTPDNQHVFLSGIEGRNLGITAPRFRDFFDFNVNDEFCYTQSKDGRFSWFRADWKIIIRKKTEISGVQYYQASHYTKTYSSFYPGDTVINYIIVPDTQLIFNYTNTHFLNKGGFSALEYSPYYTQHYKPVMCCYHSNLDLQVKTYPFQHFVPLGGDTVGDTYMPIDQKYCSEIFGVGVGLVEYRYTEYTGTPYSSPYDRYISLVGYKKGGKKVGLVYKDVDFGIFSAMSSEPAIRFSPNPTSDIVNIQVDELPLPHLLSIFSSDGRKVFEKSYDKSEIHIDIRDLDRGVYLVSVSGKSILVSKKLIKL